MSGPSIIIVGAGTSGLAMALELLRGGIDNFTILERSGDIAGTWRDTTHPGARSDIPAPVFDFTYSPKNDWPALCAAREDIYEYFADIVDEYHLDDHIEFDTEVTTAEYQENTASWVVHTADDAELTAQVLILAVGRTARPLWPDIPNIGGFSGPSFHSAEWNNAIDMTDKRVAVIGTGTSAVQFVPEIAKRAAGLTVFQRTPPWVLPLPETRYERWRGRLSSFLPPDHRLDRHVITGLLDILALTYGDITKRAEKITQTAHKHLEKHVSDPELREKLIPEGSPVGKRLLFSDDYYATLNRDNVTLVTEPVDNVMTRGVRTSDKEIHRFDVIVYSTGFEIGDLLAPITISGLEGKQLAETWSETGAHAYLGISVPDFPNLFLLHGPNTAVGIGSPVRIAEAQAAHIRQAIGFLSLRRGCALSARADVTEKWQQFVRRRLEKNGFDFTTSWYEPRPSRATTTWPGTTTAYRRKTRRFDPGSYTQHLRPPT